MADMDATSDLAAPVSTTLTADKVIPDTFLIDRRAKQIVLTVTKGHMAGGVWVETFHDSVTLKNEVNEDGTPGTQWYDLAMATTSLATMIRSAPSAVSFERIMREACTKILQAKEMI